MTVEHSKQSLLKEALIGGVINGIINGAINWFSSDKSHTYYLTQDPITSTEHTVFSAAVPLAVSLAFILSSIAYFTTKLPGKAPYFPGVFIQAIKHSIYAFGLVTIVGVLVQRTMGSVEVSPFTSAVVAGCIACLVGTIVQFDVKKKLLLP